METKCIQASGNLSMGQIINPDELGYIKTVFYVWTTYMRSVFAFRLKHVEDTFAPSVPFNL